MRYATRIPRIAKRLGAAFALLAAAISASAAQLDMTWYTVDGGGNTTSAASFELSSTIGQPDAGALAAGNFELIGGFWAVELPASSACEGDLNGDNLVDLSDLVTLLANYGSGTTPEQGDIDGDGDVDLTDLATLLSNYGEACA